VLLSPNKPAIEGISKRLLCAGEGVGFSRGREVSLHHCRACDGPQPYLDAEGFRLAHDAAGMHAINGDGIFAWSHGLGQERFAGEAAWIDRDTHRVEIARGRPLGNVASSGGALGVMGLGEDCRVNDPLAVLLTGTRIGVGILACLPSILPVLHHRPVV
jgi:hypothetical protein